MSEYVIQRLMSPKGMQGLDFRLNGEFVPGTESWFSFGYLKTEENSEDKGYSQADRSEIEIWTVIPRLHA
jgi:hypothetical protein